MTHCSTDQLHALVDGRLARNEETSVVGHLGHCAECSRAFRAIKQLDAALKKIPLEKVGPDFTRIIMDKLPASSRSSVTFRLLENVAYLFGLFIVLGVMLTALVTFGVLDTEQISQTQGVVGRAWTNVEDGAAAALSGLSDLLQRFLPFIFRAGNVSVTVFGLLVVLFLAAVDWLVRRRPVHKL